MNRKKGTPEISFVVPFFNEEECVLELYKRLKTVADREIKKEYEIIFVDDGSSDRTFFFLEKIFDKDKKVKIIRLARNFGQAIASQAGVDQATGKIIVTMDGDLQHDPEDIPNLVNKFEEGYDLVCGWRKERKDSLFTRKIPSAIASWLIRNILGVKVHDFGNFRVYRADLIREIKFYGDLHRFIPALAKTFSARITEVPIKNPPRFAGKSKYNLWRTKRVILDLITVKFLISFFSKPMQVFGFIGLICEFFSIVGLVWLLYDRLFLGIIIQNRPLFLTSIFVALLGIQFLILGLFGEMLTRIYFETKEKNIYKIDKVLSSNS